MYALLRKAKLAQPEVAGEAARRVREGAVPILQAQPGFLLHLGFLSEECEAVGISLFDDRATAQAALERLRAWTAANMSDLIQGEPHVCGGAVLHQRIPTPSLTGGGDEALFVTVREYSRVASPEEAVPLLSERVLPVVERQSGFRGFWAFRDERDPGHTVAISLWSSRGAAFTAHQRVVEITAGLQYMFPAPPRITAGAARVVAASNAD